MRKTNISVNFKDISQFSGKWKIYGLNLNVVNIISQKISINISKFIGQEKKNTISIFNSTWRHLEVSSGHIVSVSNCHFEGNVSPGETLIEVSDSSLDISNSSFHNLRVQENPAILKATASHVLIENIHCSNSIGAYGLFKVLNGSELIIKKSAFHDNGNFFSFSVIVVKYESQLVLSKCQFKRNYGLYGACLFSENSIKVVIKNCSFKINFAVVGGAMFYAGQRRNSHGNDGMQTMDQTLMKVLVCKPEQPRLDLPDYRSCKNFEIEPTYLVSDSSFQGNIASKGGAIYAQHTSVNINKSHFTKNYASYGGALMTLDVALMIQECKSFFNLAVFGSVLMARDSSSVCISSSKFYRPGLPPVAMVGSYIYIETSATLTLWNSAFHPFMMLVTNAQILSRGNNTILIHNCSFLDERRIPGFTINLKIEDLTKLTVTDTVFKTSLGFATVVLIASGNSQAIFKNCTFEKISGFALIDQASVFIQDSVISSCISTLHGTSFVYMCNGCKLTITNTNITDNVFLPSHNFLVVPTNAVVFFINVVYAKNSMSAHFLGRSGGNIFFRDCVFSENVIDGSERLATTRGLLATFENDVKIHRTQFLNNSVKAAKTSLFSVRKSRLLVDSCGFKHNFIHTKFENNMGLFTIHSAYESVFYETKFEHSGFLFVLFSLSNMKSRNNSFKVERCEFSHNLNVILQLQNITNIFIYHSRFLQHTNLAAYDNFLINTVFVRLWNSSFISMHRREYQLVFWNKLYYPHDVKLLTLNSTFTVGNETYQTNAADFQADAKAARLIGYHGIFRRIRYNETPFSSSKYRKI